MDSVCFFVGKEDNSVWVDLDRVTSLEDVLEALAEAKVIERDYNGDPELNDALRARGAKGKLAACFFSRAKRMFDLKEYLRAREEAPSPEAAADYIDWAGSWSKDDFENTYVGEYRSWDDFVDTMLGEKFDSAPDDVRRYIDIERFSNDLHDAYYMGPHGHVFRCI